MRTFAMSDIHGNYDAMIRLFNHVGYNPNEDELFVVGDMIDRGPKSLDTLLHLYRLAKMYPDKVTVLKGNHENMMEWYYEGRNQMWLQHGGYEVENDIKNRWSESTLQEITLALNWAINLPVIEVTDGYVFVHAGIISTRSLDKQDLQECIWMPYSASQIRFSNENPEDILQATHGRKVVFGHTPKPYVFDDGSKLCIDGGAGVFPDGMLRLVDLTNDTVYETAAGRDNLHETRVNKKKVARKRVKA